MVRGITFGTFDLLHAGHVAMLEEARSKCDWLIVGLHTDPSKERNEKNAPIQTVFERYLQLKACRWVDEIIPYDTEQDLFSILVILKPDVRILGEEYRDREYTGKYAGPREYFNTRSHAYSSSDLRKRICG